MHHVTSSSADRKASNMKSDLDEFKNNMNEMKSISNINLKKLRSSIEDLVDADDSEMNQPLVTFPDESPCVSELSSPTNVLDTIKFEQKTMNNFKKTKVSLHILVVCFVCCSCTLNWQSSESFVLVYLIVSVSNAQCFECFFMLKNTYNPYK